MTEEVEGELLVLTASQLMAAMDQSTDPCEDFFQYACGTWNKKHIIPEDRPSFNTFEKLHDDLQVTLKGKCLYAIISTSTCMNLSVFWDL